jgi:protein-disulfide isomerase
VPAAIREFYRSGKVNVIEFADFECPFCRRLHGQLKELLQPYGKDLHVVRLHVPLDSHPHARFAALAAICAEPSGKADALSEFLFATEDLSQGAIQKQVARLGIDRAAFDACVAAPASARRLDRERGILHDIGFEGLPTTYIGETRIVGAQAKEVFQDALELAAQGSGERGVPAWAYLAIALGIAGAIIRLGWITGLQPAAERPRPSKA